MYKSLSFLGVMGVICAMLAFTVGQVPAKDQSGVQVGQKDNGFSKCDERYLAQRVDYIAKFGHQSAGRNLVRRGLLGDRNRPVPISDHQACSEADYLHNKVHPPPAQPPAQQPTDSSTVGYTQSAPAPAPAPTSSGGCPSYMAGEASSPDAVNPSSGAAGCYQVLPSTAARMGSACADVNSTSCVAAICASSGNSAWNASGATPCDYISEP